MLNQQKQIEVLNSARHTSDIDAAAKQFIEILTGNLEV